MTISIKELGDIAGKFDISNDEAERIAATVDTEAAFVEVWEDTDWWSDRNNRLVGSDAIAAKEKNESIVLNKYADPTEGAAEGISLEVARQVALEDPSLVYCSAPSV